MVKLTHRELQVLRGICDGDSAKDIAENLIISVRTVDFHTANLLDKTQLHSRAKLAKWARIHGVLNLE